MSRRVSFGSVSVPGRSGHGPRTQPVVDAGNPTTDGPVGGHMDGRATVRPVMRRRPSRACRVGTKNLRRSTDVVAAARRQSSPQQTTTTKDTTRTPRRSSSDSPPSSCSRCSSSTSASTTSPSTHSRPACSPPPSPATSRPNTAPPSTHDHPVNAAISVPVNHCAGLPRRFRSSAPGPCGSTCHRTGKQHQRTNSNSIFETARTLPVRRVPTRTLPEGVRRT